ncbi:MAG: hypothetical protein JXA33_12305 [Anaerolineae bacterium]|nr:hypothetical protein [Anaerolineae bacterium]
MTTLDDLFVEYLGRIEPKQIAVKRAKESHDPLRKDLENDEIYGPFVIRTLLSGSYGRDTATFFIKDVDVIIQTSLRETDLQERARQDETEQQCLLRLTQEAIRRTGRATYTRKARRSIYVKLLEEVTNIGETIPEMTMDIVPVLIQTNKDHDPMTIADKELQRWFNTYPLTQLEDSRQRNEQSSLITIGSRHSYKPLVKIFKAWKQVHFRSVKTPKGFILECLTAQYHNPDAQHWAEAVRDLFQNICTAWPEPEALYAVPEVHDISSLSPHRIPIAKTREEAQRVIQKIHDHLELLDQAIEEAQSDLYKSARTLQRVFGQDCETICFPLPQDKDGGGSKSSPFTQKSRSDVREAPAFG